MGVAGVPICCCECPVYGDDFFREDSDDLGPEWEEVAGTWAISNTSLYESGTSDAIAIFSRNFGTPTMNVSVFFAAEEEDSILRVIVNYLNPQNYMFAELDVAGEQINMYQVVGGEVTKLGDASILGMTGEHRIMHVCLGRDNFTAWVEGAVVSRAWVDIGPVHSLGFLAGVGNGNDTPAWFDDFEIMEHSDTNPICPGCVCRCDGNDWPVDLHGTLYGSGKVALLNGLPVEFTLQYDRIAATWKGEFVVVGEDSAWSQTWKMGITCVETVADAEIFWTEYNHGCATSGISFALQEGSTCSPLELVFHMHVPAFFLSCPPLAPTGESGDFWIYLTE